MSRKPVSLEVQMRGQTAPVEQQGEAKTTSKPLTEFAMQEKTTVYMPRAALKCLKQMALDQDKRINDLLQEAVDLMFERYGQPSLKDFAQR